MTWVETDSPSFAARHDATDTDDVHRVLELLEDVRADLARVLPETPPAPIAVVVHGSRVQLYSAQPHLLAVTRLTAPAARRYLTGWAGPSTLHVLAPRIMRGRASSVQGSREMAELGPAALYAQLAVGWVNPRLPPPLTLRSAAGVSRWAWLAAGAAQWLAGQTPYARPAIARRLREGKRPAFPPGARDAVLLGGTVVDLLAAEEGDAAAIALACDARSATPADALLTAFHGRPLARTEDAWRSHLERAAGGG